MSFEPEISSGDTGEHVTMLQERLYQLGHYDGQVDGEFGTVTEQAVQRFQEATGHEQDGQVGPLTWQALEYQEQANAEPAATEQQTEPVWSDDGQYWWDGTEWQAAAGDAAGEPDPTPSEEQLSSDGQLSPDGQWQWDGTDWRAVVGFDAGTPDAGRLLGIEQEHPPRDGRPQKVTGPLTKEEARKLVTPDIRPKECFITYRGTKEGWDAISGTGCAHWVAHERGIKGNTNVCAEGYLYRVDDVVATLTRLSPDLSRAVVGAVWKQATGSHIGIVREVKRDNANRIVSVDVENDSSEQGGVVVQNKTDGSVWN